MPVLIDDPRKSVISLCVVGLTKVKESPLEPTLMESEDAISPNPKRGKQVTLVGLSDPGGGGSILVTRTLIEGPPSREKLIVLNENLLFVGEEEEEEASEALKRVADERTVGAGGSFDKLNFAFSFSVVGALGLFRIANNLFRKAAVAILNQGKIDQ
jgi:hypothetical protein